MVRFAGLDSNNEFEAETVKDHIKNLAASAVDVSGLANQVSGAVTHQSVADRLDIDLGTSINEISEVTGPTDVYFKDVTTPDGRTNPDGMGTLLIVEKGADHLTWPGGTRIHGRPPVNSESFASLVRVSGTVHVIWSAVDSTPPPPPVTGGGSDVVLATLDDVLQGKIRLAPGGSVISSEDGMWRFTNLTSTPTTEPILTDGIVYISHSAGSGSIIAGCGAGGSSSVLMELSGPDEGVPPEPGSGWIIATYQPDGSEDARRYFNVIQSLVPECVVKYNNWPTSIDLVLPLDLDNDHITIDNDNMKASYGVNTLGYVGYVTYVSGIMRPLPQEELEELGFKFVFEYLSPERMAQLGYTS